MAGLFGFSASSNEQMVASLRVEGFVKSPEVERAFLETDRSFFCPPSQQSEAFHDHPLPIVAGQTISAPSIVAIMTELLMPLAGKKILEVGLGSGYQAAILSKLAGPKGRVFSVERVPEVFDYGRNKLATLKIKNVETICADGSKGLVREAQFDRILVTAAAPSVPRPLLEQLAPNGKLAIPVSSFAFGQDLVLLEKDFFGQVSRKSVLPVIFVPLVGEHGFSKS